MARFRPISGGFYAVVAVFAAATLLQSATAAPLMPLQLQTTPINPPASLEAVKALLGRALPADVAAALAVAVEPSLSPSGEDVFSLQGGGAEAVTITGSTIPAVTAGVGHFLKYYANASFAWSGSQMNISLPLAEIPSPVVVKAALKWRYYLNTCTHSYTMAFWDWPRWEREIDWMALHGINMPLAFTGQEALWYDLFKQFNVTDAELEEWFTGPAYLAWFRMGNIRAYGGPLGPNWRAVQKQLQLNILPRMRSLGMTTVLPGFAGHVPAGLARAFPSAKITRSALWAGFDDKLSGDYLLDSRDPLFGQLASAFTRVLIDNYGTDHVYNADTFNEMVPSSNDTTYLKELGASLYGALADSDPDAVWMVQGWMFSFDANFWKPAQIQAYLSGIPPHKLIILDLDAFADPIWSKTESFYNTDFVWCIIDNAGGRPGIFGDLQRVTSGPVDANRNATSMVGVGLAPEGTQQNPITFELMAEMGWRSDAVDLANDWVAKYVRRRYGPNAPSQLYDAWAIMLPNLYNNMDQHFSAMYADVPSLKMGGYSSWTNATAMIEVWRLFHEAAPAVATVDPFRFDYVDVTRQAMGYIFEDLYVQVVGAYKVNDTRGLSAAAAAMHAMVEDIDAVLATHSMWMVGGWVNDARAKGATPQESDLYEVSARRLITTWGDDGQLNGYATRELAGLNVDFHLPKWQLFTAQLVEALEAGKEWDAGAFSNNCFFNISLPWTNAHNTYARYPATETTAVIDAMFRKYAGSNAGQPLARKGYRVHPDSDGNGALWGNLKMQLHDPSVGEFLCNVQPDCGGFVADGWYKPLYSPPVPYNGSTFYKRVMGPCDDTTLCSAPVSGASECNYRCNCFWDPAKDTCGCVGQDNHPACEAHYPAPSTDDLASLAAADPPLLRTDDRISFFGDSITWLGGYIGLIGEALAANGLGNVTLSNRGIDGGCVKDLRNGTTLFGWTYPDFDTVLEQDAPTIVTIFIGMNDVWFPQSTHHSDPEPFKAVLSSLVASARARGATVVLYTLSVHGELTTGTQPFDKNMTIYTEAIREVAAAVNAPLGDTHANYLAYERAHNTQPAGGIPEGVLTVHGVHPCLGGNPRDPCPIHTHGNRILANTMAQGLAKALKAGRQ